MTKIIPLAERLRPRSLPEVWGQKHLTGKDAPLQQMLDQGRISSMILYGPPGTGKTTIAQILAREAQLPFEMLSAVSAGVKEVRAIIEKSQAAGESLVVFIDEIHRFNKTQQDSLLGAIEQGLIILIGATTENPSFEINRALLSRCQLFKLQLLTEKDLSKILERGLTELSKKISGDVSNFLIHLAQGDGRKLLSSLEAIANNATPKLTVDEAKAIIQQSYYFYDKAGDQHYQIISAFIKSMRGSDPNAAVYWLARMIEGGEKPEFMARRMIIFASEDIGLTNPNALLLANAAFDAINKVGWPESRIILSQCAVYLAKATKSNKSYQAINKAQAEVEKSGNLPVPMHLQNAVTALDKQEGKGKGYLYPHDFEGARVAQQYLPDQLIGTIFFEE